MKAEPVSRESQRCLLGVNMSPWLSLIPIAFIMCVGSYLSYQRNIKDSVWFAIAMVILATFNALLWVAAVRWSESQRQLFSISICIDVLTVLAYSVLPLIACGVKLSPTALVGVGLVVVGSALVKFGG